MTTPRLATAVLLAALAAAWGDGTAGGQPDKKTTPRGDLKIEVTPGKVGEVELRVTLTNTAKELLVNTWRSHRMDGVRLQVTDEKGTQVRTHLFGLDMSLELEPKYVVLKPGESRSVTFRFPSIIEGERAPGTYKVKATYRNTFQDETYEAKEIEVTVRPK